MAENHKNYRKGKPMHPVLHRTIRPFREFMRIEASSGALLIVFMAVALLWVNLPIGWTYDALWGTHITVGIGAILINEPLGFWINDLLMTVFFFLIGLEIKRELLIGWLSSLQQAILPVIAAIGGMVVPALIYSAFNPPGSPGAAGWAIPMATDIAICLGIIGLIGSRIPTPLKVFLTTLAIADDLGGILIIALFYSHGLEPFLLLLTVPIVLYLAALNRYGVRMTAPYLLGGAFLWIVLFFGGVHPTITGVLLAMSIPATTKIDFREFHQIEGQLHDRLEKIMGASAIEVDAKAFQNTTHTLEIACRDAEAPLQRIEVLLAPWVAFLIIPLFALANAGVRIDVSLSEIVTQPVTLGIVFGLVIGKPLGILSSLWIAERTGRLKIPEIMNRDLLVGLAVLSGVGFTIALFVGNLSFPPGDILEYAKAGILIASLISGLLATVVIKLGQRRCEEHVQEDGSITLQCAPEVVV